MEMNLTVWEQIVQTIDLPFLTTIWFYAAVAAVTWFMTWYKDQDFGLHKRWYLPIAFVASYLGAVGMVLVLPDITWSMLFENGLFVFVGQLIIGDQVIKRLGDKLSQNQKE